MVPFNDRSLSIRESIDGHISTDAATKFYYFKLNKFVQLFSNLSYHRQMMQKKKIATGEMQRFIEGAWIILPGLSHIFYF